jgi:hypothetical protein
MNKVVSILVGTVVIVGIGGLVYWQVFPKDSATDAPGVTTSTDEQSATTGGSGAITMAVLAVHGDASSCWSVINGGVYDLTSWIPQHPGGSEAIIRLCGTDGSEKFNGVHGGQKLQLNILAGFKIGTLAQ